MFRFPHPRLTWLLLPASLVAQPVAPFPYPVAGNHRPSALEPRTATATPLTVNIASREEVREFYRAIYFASEGVPMAWTGDYTSGNAGDTSAAFKEAVRLRINFFRALVGVPAAITFNSTYSSEDQQAALMMSGNNTLQHTGIPTTWTYYTTAGATAAANSNLALGQSGPGAITGYMIDGGSNNAAVGHRRWIEYPQTLQMGTGDVPGNGTLLAANATWVIDSNYGANRPATRTTQVPYPPAGYVPYQLVWPRWSFTYPGADFSAATVTMTSNGQSIATALEPLSNNVGEPTLAWAYNGLDDTSELPHPKPTSDTTYSVTVANVRINGVAQSFTYNVTVFDPDVAGSDYVPVSISGSSSPAVGSATSYTVNVPNFASSFDWRTLQLATFATTYDAEAGLNGITASTSPGYSVVQSSIVGAGTASFHLAHPNPPTDQILTLPDLLFVTASTAAVNFLSELGWASANQTAHLQVSLDDGNSWSDLYTQTGTGTQGETSFVHRSASLAAYVGRTIRLRFAYTFSTSTFYPQTDPGVGWYIDNISVSGVQSASAGAATNVASGSSFSFTPSATGSVALQARGELFGAYPLEWGPLDQVTAVASSTPNTTYLSNLSVRTTAGTGAQTLIAGFTIRGGSKQVLIRGVGPTLTSLGVPGALADPRLDIYDGTTQALLLGNDNWNATDATTFTSVGAFSLPTGSKDAAIVTTLGANGYTAQVSGVGGTTGIALVELYDVSGTGNGARLFNVSARSQVGTGDGVLIAGFSIAGSGQRKLLVRAVGPTLAQYGVTGVLANPTLAIYTLAGTKLQEDDDWGGVQSIVDAANSVGAFALPAASLDSALIVTLPAGAYTAQVSGVNNTTGVALVEVYELP